MMWYFSGFLFRLALRLSLPAKVVGNVTWFLFFPTFSSAITKLFQMIFLRYWTKAVDIIDYIYTLEKRCFQKFFFFHKLISTLFYNNIHSEDGNLSLDIMRLLLIFFLHFFPQKILFVKLKLLFKKAAKFPSSK